MKEGRLPAQDRIEAANLVGVSPEPDVRCRSCRPRMIFTMKSTIATPPHGVIPSGGRDDAVAGQCRRGLRRQIVSVVRSRPPPSSRSSASQPIWVAATPVFGSGGRAAGGRRRPSPTTEPLGALLRLRRDGRVQSQQVVAVLVMVPSVSTMRTVTARVITGADAETPSAADSSQFRVPPKPSASVAAHRTVLPVREPGRRRGDAGDLQVGRDRVGQGHRVGDAQRGGVAAR